ncbi:MAG: PTS glucitol/sorbitol transporter subunit IIC [Peptoniphilaceae bacterium]|nr:PTS glucitol/sorbitol transporter subunit IIC [Peptoniphilaceae bacterium]MDY6018254.1 PTS glucitol/sorbitol transporter subunit IIC [Anaerococcus sp.]
MNFLVKFAQGFIGLFELGAGTFVDWVGGIIPKVLLLLVFMNSLISLIGVEKVNKFAKFCSKRKILAYGILPFVSAFMVGNPMALSMGKFLPEYQKPSYYATAAYHCHTNNGLFPHINPGELFVWLGIANGVEKLGLDVTPLAIRYMLVGLVMNFFAGWITDFTTNYVEKQQNVKLKRTIDVEAQ